MREAEELVDVTLVFEERRVKCHKVILAGTSDYFRGMFLTDMAESASREIVMEEISASIGALLINFMYGGLVEITTQNAQDLLTASDMLLLDALKQQIEKFLCRNIESTNCISLLNLAQFHDLKLLMEDSRNFLLDHVDGIDVEEMNLLQEGTLIEIIQLSASSSPEDSFRLIQKWVRLVEGRSESFLNLMQHVSLSKCSKEFIRSTVMQEELMANEQGERLIEAAMQTDSHEQHLVVCGWGGQLREEFGTSGRQNPVAQTDCFLYEALSNEWRTLPPMPTARYNHSSIHHKNNLFVVGGKKDGAALNSIETLDRRNGKWSCLPPMPRGLEHALVVFVLNRLFVLGGSFRNVIIDQCVQVNEYDAILKEWVPRSPMPEECEGASAVSLEDHIYVVGGHDRRCMRYNPRDDTWLDIALHRPHFVHIFSPALVWEGKIVICGGDMEASAHTEEYNHWVDRWARSWLTFDVLPMWQVRSAFAMDIPS
ncbi:hypothetical protein CAPTEDRAFT_151100 [Capitella teleta]|uniref:BTB domain-containing protein n=1 Tax=Capitella teleta TaxID=283909 RepID=R7TDX7_CAPTE|nr:hypothetical protein CAPTEDRAFT_151100 [Capitella teleta]|eukprot:ELT89241.1 hypothetical protein CAPTEDRAFT_151100 [Capitella teleta]